MGLLSEIQQDIIKPEVPLASILRKALIFAHDLDNKEFKNWVDWELNGYPPWSKPETFKDFATRLPPYRVSEADLLCDTQSRHGLYQYRRVPIRIPNLPDEARLFWTIEGVPTLEKLVAEEGEILKLFSSGALIELLNQILQAENKVCITAWKEVHKNFIVRILEIVRDRLLKFTLELKHKYPDLDHDKKTNQVTNSDQQISNIFHMSIYGVNKMFDQRGQSVSGDQYNAARDINFGAVNNTDEYASELEKLQQELSKAVDAGELDEDTAIDAEYHLKKATQQTKKPNPNKSTILSHLSQAKDLVLKVGGLALAVTSAIEALDKLF